MQPRVKVNYALRRRRPPSISRCPRLTVHTYFLTYRSVHVKNVVFSTQFSGAGRRECQIYWHAIYELNGFCTAYTDRWLARLAGSTSKHSIILRWQTRVWIYMYIFGTHFSYPLAVRGTYTLEWIIHRSMSPTSPAFRRTALYCLHASSSTKQCTKVETRW